MSCGKWDLSSLTREPVAPALGAHNLNHWPPGKPNTIVFLNSLFWNNCESYLGSSAGPSGKGNGTPLQYSCLANPMDGGAWWAAAHAVSRSRTRLSDFTFTFTFMHWRRKWQPTLIFLPGESQGWGSLVGCRLCSHPESDTTEAT